MKIFTAVVIFFLAFALIIVSSSRILGKRTENQASFLQSMSDGNDIIPLGVNFIIKDETGSDAIGGRPAIATDGTNFYVVWCKSGAIFGARISQDGTVLDANSIANSSGANVPSAAFDGTNFFVVWAAGEVYGARVTREGIALDPTPIQITTGGNPKERPITIAFDGTNYLIAWRTQADEIRGIRVSTSGVGLDNLAGFNIGGGFYPWVAFDGTNYLVVWHKWGNGLDIYGARISQAGSVIDPGGFPVCAENGDQDHASIAFGNTTYFVSWHDWRGGDEYNQGSARGTRVNLNGVVLDSPALVIAEYTYAQVPVVVAFDGTNYFVVWHEGGVTANFRLADVFGRRVSANGVVLDQKSIPISTSQSHQWGPRLAFLNNKYLAVWGDLRWYLGRIYGQMLEKQSAAPSLTQEGGAWRLSSNSSFQQSSNQQGNGWQPETSPTTAFITDLYGLDGNHIYGVSGDSVGSDAAVLQYNGSQWSVWRPITHGRDFAIWASSPNDVWTAGWCWDVWRYDGSSWSSTNCMSYEIGIGMWGTDRNNVFTVGTFGTQESENNWHWYDGSRWYSSPTGSLVNLWDIWGTSAQNIYAVGEFGTVFRNEGSTWNRLSNIPTFQSLNAIWGSSAGDIFIVGDNGTILHYNGSSWTSQTSGTREHLNGVWGFSPTNVYAVGLHGTILYYDGSSWSLETSGTNVNLFDVWSTGNSVWAAGDHGTILKKTISVTYPSAPANPLPSDGAVGVSIPTALDWDDCLNADSYDVYLGTAPSPPKVANVANSTYSPGILNSTTNYYWKIAAINYCGSTEGPEWKFTTANLLTTSSTSTTTTTSSSSSSTSSSTTSSVMPPTTSSTSSVVPTTTSSIPSTSSTTTTTTSVPLSTTTTSSSSSSTSSSSTSSIILLTTSSTTSSSVPECPRLGDVNGDGNITPGDAQKAFEIYLGRLVPDDCQKETSDANCNGSTTPGDAQWIFEHYLGKRVLPERCGGSILQALEMDKLVSQIRKGERWIKIGEGMAESEGLVAFPIEVSDASGIKAFGMDLRYDENRMQFVGVRRTENTKDFMAVDGNSLERGIIRVGGYSTDGIQKNLKGALAILLFKIKDSRGKIEIINVVDDLESFSKI